MLEIISDRERLQQALTEHTEFCALFFWGPFSEPSRRALGELEQFAEQYRDVPVLAVDVQQARGVHKDYGVDSVPTVLVLKGGRETERFAGVESAAFYATHLAGTAPGHVARPTPGKPPRVTVYTSPGCAPCSQVKRFLREHGISFTSIDISQDEQAAREIVRRSGQQAVPQIDINGRIVVGFDRMKLSGLLGIGS